MADLTQLLVAAGQADTNAENTLKEWETQNFPDYAQRLAVELATSGKPINARQLAGLMLKNCLFAKDTVMQREKHDRWKRLDPQIRGNIKDSLMAGLRSTESVVPHTSAQAAAEIAAVELPHGEWGNFLPAVMENVSSPNFPEAVKEATLECLGYTCERAENLEGPDINEQTTDAMLNAIVQGINPSNPDRIRLAAATALKNSLAFTHKNMEVKGERDMIVSTICEATTCTDARVRTAAYQCIVEIAVRYYDKLQDYMTTLYDLTTKTIRADEEEVAKAAIEFWCSLTEVEMDMLEEEQIQQERGVGGESQCRRYVAAALNHLAPILTETLTKQEEDDDEDDYNLHMAGHICLNLISVTVQDAIVPVIMPFVNSNIQSDNWRLRDAAIMAFISLLDGPSQETIGPSVTQSVPVLLGLLNDPNTMVRDSAAHCISKICLYHTAAIPNDSFPTLLQALIAKCNEQSPKVASQAASAIYNLGAAFSSDEPRPTTALSPYMTNLLQTLLQVSDRPDANESNLRVASMEAISILIANSAEDCKPLLVQLLPEIVGRLERTHAMNDLSGVPKEVKEQIQGLLCAIIQVLCQKLDKMTIEPVADKIMENIIHVLQSKSASCHEECFNCISAVADIMEGSFVKYMSHLQPYILAGLSNFEAYQVCISAVGAVGDISRAIEGQLQPFCDDIMKALVESLKDSRIMKEVKPPVLSCFGEIALAIGGAYEPYLATSVMMLMQASEARVPEDDEDMIDFFNELRESILESYMGIIQGLRDGGKLPTFMQYMQPVLLFIQRIAEDPNRDEEVLNKSVGLVGDIAQLMGPQMKQHLNQPWVGQLLNDAVSSGDQSLMEVATWAHGVVQQACQG